MKWIGQHIWDFVSRFRSDVYLDSPTAGGSDPDKFLGIDSNNKIIYRTGTQVLSDIGGSSSTGDVDRVSFTTGDTNIASVSSGNADFNLIGGTGIDTTSVHGGANITISTDVSDFMTNGSDNRILTATGADAMNAEANFTFDGSDALIQSNTSNKPNLTLYNYTNNELPSKLIFKKSEGNNITDPVSDNDQIGTIVFNALTDGEAFVDYASILSTVIDASANNERGSLEFYVRAHESGSGGSSKLGFRMLGMATDTVDINLGYGATSTTTITGTLTMGSTATLDNSGNLLTNAATATTATTAAALTSGDKTIQGNLRIGGSGDTSNNWITIDAQNGTDTTGGGICFYETGTDTIGAPQYGAKIVYNEDDDEFAIGTMHGGVFQRQIYMARSWDNVKFADAAFVEGTTPSLALKDTSTTVANTDILGTLYWENADDGGATARIQAVATENHASGANGGTKIEFLTTPNTTSTEATALTIGQDQSLTVAGDLTVNGDTVTFESANADDPALLIKNTTNNNQGARLKFDKNRGVDAQDNDVIGEIEFHSYDDGTPSTQQYAKILAQVHDATSGQESGRLKFGVASHDGTNDFGLILEGGSQADEVDVTVGLGSESVTSIAGSLRPKGQLHMTHHNFNDDIDTTKHYIGLARGDSENTSTSQIQLPLVFPTAAKLLKLYLRANQNLSAKTLTFTLET